MYQSHDRNTALPEAHAAPPANIADESSDDCFQVVDIEGDQITLHSFQMRNADIAGYLIKQPLKERAGALISALQVGVFCLERASTAKDTEFVKRQVERLLHEVQSKVGEIPSKVQTELLTKVGGGDGQVLKPLVDATSSAVQQVNARISQCETFVKGLFDPTGENGAVGKALQTLSNMLDPKRTDSVQLTVQAAINDVSKADGLVAKCVNNVVAAAIAPLKGEVEKLAMEVRGQEAVDEALKQTTEKGVPYEEEVVNRLQPWAKAIGAQVKHVGGDKRPGDIVITFNGTSIASIDCCLVIEARDRERPVGRKRIAEELASSMSERSANAGIYLSR
jgi:hypothetical protein